MSCSCSGDPRDGLCEECAEKFFDGFEAARRMFGATYPEDLPSDIIIIPSDSKPSSGNDRVDKNNGIAPFVSKN